MCSRESPTNLFNYSRYTRSTNINTLRFFPLKNSAKSPISDLAVDKFSTKLFHVTLDDKLYNFFLYKGRKEFIIGPANELTRTRYYLVMNKDYLRRKVKRLVSSI